MVEGLELQFGDSVKAVGGDAGLGGWAVAEAPFLEWSEGHHWRGQVQLPAGDHRFKVDYADCCSSGTSCYHLFGMTKLG